MTPNFDHVSPEFERAIHGYISCGAERVPVMLQNLPLPVSMRERAIVAALRWRLDNPASDAKRLEPLVFEHRPAVAMRVHP
jgi:hypothetical protein